MKKQYYDFLVDEVKLRPHQQDISSNNKQKITCLLCGYTFKATPKGKVNNFRKHGIPGCKMCTHKTKYIDNQEQHINSLKPYYDLIKLPKELGHLSYNDKILVKRKECSHSFSVNWYNIKGQTEYCPICNTERKKEHFQDMNERRHEESYHLKKGFDAYKQKVYKLTRETYRKHKKRINPDNHKRTLSGGEGYHLDHIISVRNSFDLDVPPEVCADHRNLRMVKWKSNNQKWKRSSLNIPDPFLPYVETSSQDFLNDIKVFANQQGLEEYKDFGKYMLTLYSEENKFGVYFADLRTNSEQIVGSKKYFKEMKSYFDDLDIKIVIVFEDEWKTNKQLVLSKILHYMGNNTRMRVHARTAYIREITNKEKNEFLNSNHIQGTSVSQINLGAFFDDEDGENYLGAVMTFCKPRVLMNKKEKGEGVHELARFATANHLRIPGIASKLLKYFERNYEWKEIFSYADLRWSDGNLYDVLGFEKDVVNPPSYHYVIDGVRKHRWGYRKDSLKERFPDKYDDKLTEYHNMLNMGFDRIWDCGTIKYIKVKE